MPLQGWVLRKPSLQSSSSLFRLSSCASESGAARLGVLGSDGGVVPGGPWEEAATAQEQFWGHHGACGWPLCPVLPPAPFLIVLHRKLGPRSFGGTANPTPSPSVWDPWEEGSPGASTPWRDSLAGRRRQRPGAFTPDVRKYTRYLHMSCTSSVTAGTRRRSHSGNEGKLCFTARLTEKAMYTIVTY